jgi:hypothetical protein
LAVSLVQAFLKCFTSSDGELVPPGVIESAKRVYKNRDFNKGLGTCQNNGQHSKEHCMLCAKAFSTKVGDGADPVIVVMELLTSDSPGVMLIKLAS